MDKTVRRISRVIAGLIFCAAAATAPSSAEQRGLGVSATVLPSKLQVLQASKMTVLDAWGSQQLSADQKELFIRDPAAFAAQLQPRKTGDVRITILH